MFVKLNSPPKPLGDHYLQADYIELLTLTNADKTLFAHDVYSRQKEDASFDEDNKFEENGDDQFSRYDNQTRLLEKWFEHLAYRATAFAEFYPFKLISPRSLMLLHELTDKQTFYVYLLLASCLRHLSKSDGYTVASEFERISATALKEYLGPLAEVRVFGKGRYCEYRGNKLRKLEKLAEQLRVVVRIDEDYFPATDSGDEGLDVVGWIGMPDDSSGLLTLFGQCACTIDWHEKALSVDHYKWRHLIELSVTPVNIAFVPYCFRDASGFWFHPHICGDSVVIDRLRFVHLLSRRPKILEGLSEDAIDIIDKVIDFSEET